MKTTLLITLVTSLLSLAALAQVARPLGPNGGRVVDLDSAKTPYAEFNIVGDKFVVTLLNEAMQPVPVSGQALSVTAGDRSDPKKPLVEVKDGAFVAGPKPPGEDYWVILQLRETPEAKPITFRVKYQTHICSGCGNQEWLCTCGHEPRS